MRAFELKQSKNQLVIFDIDDTLLHTTAKINVVKDGKVVRSLTNQEFNNYKLQPGEEFDFGEFRDARKFEEESVPIGPMLDKLKQDLAAGHDVVMLTARADFDNQKAVWRTFKRHGIDINRDVHLYRAGNLPGDAAPAYKKAVHVTKWLNTGKYDHVTMYDDSEKNLSVFKGLEKNFPNVDFEAHHVSPEGATKQVEEAISPEVKSNFVEMFAKFLPVAIKVLKLDSLPKFVFKGNIEHSEQPTFGMYVNEENTLYVALLGRHPNDILRTTAHELVHYKQDVEHQLGQYSGDTGSPEENDANARAGVIMRHFNKMYPEYLQSKPVVTEKWTTKYKRSINCANPKGFSQRAHCQGRKKNEAVNPEIVKKDFHAEKVVQTAKGPIQLVASTPSEHNEVFPQFYIKGYNEENKPVAFLRLNIRDLEKLNAWLPWQRKDFKNAYLVAGNVSVDDNYRRLGIASEMYKFAKELGNDVKPSSTQTPDGKAMWKGFQQKATVENFADGKKPGRKGLAKRVGVNCKQSVTKLRSIAKKSSGERQRMAHWCANMKGGKK